MGTVRFGNDQILKIMRYGEYQLGNVTISRVYYVEELGHNLFSVESRDTNLYTFSLDDMLKSSLIYLLSKAFETKIWLWHRRLSHLNFGTINQLAKQGLVLGLPKLKFTWVKILRSKDKTPEDIIKCLKRIQVRLNAIVRNIRTDNGTEFVNKTLRSYYEDVRISYQTLVARTPQQNVIVERRNQNLVKAARTMMIFSKAPFYLWAEAVSTAYKTYLHVFGALCYPTNDSEDLDKLKPKADIGIFIGYAPVKNAYQIYNRRARMILETIHVDFDELTTMASEQFLPVAAAPRPADPTSIPLSTSIDQDAPSLQLAQFDNDPFRDILTEEPNSREYSSNVQSTSPPFELLGKWTKNHPLENVIDRPVSTRCQL
ncbi:retrovirus-related pol polyprotein from transposon TNT 1-94 [Tanacetum coccineum]|uniref:Retrovirus-related pol polyprotein from transposon TNT 1-94 n=1 Tax=Tanacetum coccineum TaxID=301880 RepID=A0ABQ5E5U1_9ASTR